MKQDNLSPLGFDLTNLLEFTGGDKTLALKYINIFIGSSQTQLKNIENALARVDGDLLYISLHTLKPQLELIGIHSAFHKVDTLLVKLKGKPEMSEAVKTAASNICEQITVACKELDEIKKTLKVYET